MHAEPPEEPPWGPRGPRVHVDLRAALLGRVWLAGWWVPCRGGLGCSLLAVPPQVRKRPLSSLGPRRAAGSAAAAVRPPIRVLLSLLLVRVWLALVGALSASVGLLAARSSNSGPPVGSGWGGGHCKCAVGLQGTLVKTHVASLAQPPPDPPAGWPSCYLSFGERYSSSRATDMGSIPEASSASLLSDAPGFVVVARVFAKR